MCLSKRGIISAYQIEAGNKMRTDSSEFQFLDGRQSQIIAVKANAGTITVEANAQGTWLQIAQFSADTVQELFVRDVRFRIVVGGAAEYSIL